MINFEQYLIERKGSIVTQPKPKRKVNIEELKQMIANKDSSIANVDVSEITSMSALFKNSDFGGSWTADLSGWDTSKVENMSFMFHVCTNLKEVALPHTENVMNMSDMFIGCKNLTKVALPHTENVEDMSYMFGGCAKLKEVNLPHTEKVENMSWMFWDCINLQQDFSSWDISNVNEKNDMFDGCTKMEDAKMNGNDLYPKGYK